MWTYRRSIPPDLRDVLGRTEIVRSLHTGDLDRAERLAAALDVEICRIFAIAARIACDEPGATGMVEDDGGDVLRGQEMIEKLCDTYLRRLLAEDRASRQSGEESGDVDGGMSYVVEGYANDYYQQRVEVVEEVAQGLLKAEGADLTGAQLRALLDELLRTRVTALKAAIAERSSDAEFDPRSVQLRPSSISAAPPPDPAALHTVGELAELYLKHQRETGTWKQGRVTHDRTKAVERFVEWLGADTPLSKVNPEVCQGVFEMFRERGLAPTTQNKELKGLRAFFSYGIALEWMARNPAKSLKIQEPPAREQRYPFDLDDLRALFGASFSEAAMARPVGGAAKGAKSRRVYMPERYWGPLLSLFAGLRVGEIVRLRPSHFKTVDDILCLSVEPEPDDSLKTEASQRLVPVHSHLVNKLGLMDFVEEQSAKGEIHLFPRAASLSKPEATLTSWFRTYRHRVGIEDKRKTFHSLRHTFRRHLSDAGAQDSTVSDLMGHANATITHGRYGSRANVGRLRTAIECLDFRELLSELRKP